MCATQACLSALFLGAAVGAFVAVRRVRRSLREAEEGGGLLSIEGKAEERTPSPDKGSSNALRLSYGPTTPSKVFPLLKAEDSVSPLPTLPSPEPERKGAKTAGAAAGKPEVFV